MALAATAAAPSEHPCSERCSAVRVCVCVCSVAVESNYCLFWYVDIRSARCAEYLPPAIHSHKRAAMQANLRRAHIARADDDVGLVKVHYGSAQTRPCVRVSSACMRECVVFAERFYGIIFVVRSYLVAMPNYCPVHTHKQICASPRCRLF